MCERKQRGKRKRERSGRGRNKQQQQAKAIMRQYHIAAVVVTTTTTTSTPTEGQEHLKMLISYSNETMHRLLVFRCKQTPACLGSTEQTAAAEASTVSPQSDSCVSTTSSDSSAAYPALITQAHQHQHRQDVCLSTFSQNLALEGEGRKEYRESKIVPVFLVRQSLSFSHLRIHFHWMQSPKCLCV